MKKVFPILFTIAMMHAASFGQGVIDLNGVNLNPVTKKLDSLSTAAERQLQLSKDIQEQSKSNLELSKGLVRLAEQSKESQIQMQKLTKQLVGLGGENNKLQTNISTLTGQLVGIESENNKLQTTIKELTKTLVGYATESHNMVEASKTTNKALFWFTIAVGICTIIQTILAFLFRKAG